MFAAGVVDLFKGDAFGCLAMAFWALWINEHVVTEMITCKYM